MKFVSFGPAKRLGVIDGECILDLRRAAETAGSDGEAFTSWIALIESGERGLEAVRRLLEVIDDLERPGVWANATTVGLHAPFPGRRFALAGSNNADHVADLLSHHGRHTTAAEVRAKTRTGPAGGYWAIDPPLGPDAVVTLPRSANGLFDYEGELAVVLAKGGKRLTADQWRSRIWGTTLVIDWSIRRHRLDDVRRPFYAHKNFDNAKSLGPWILVSEDVDPLNCVVETRVNGELRQRFNSGDMIHTYCELLEQLSEDLTLWPGDVLSGGTGAGTAFDRATPTGRGELPRDLFLKPGDRVEVSTPRHGVLAARIVDFL